MRSYFVLLPFVQVEGSKPDKAFVSVILVLSLVVLFVIVLL
jgi:hypothetical protein